MPLSVQLVVDVLDANPRGAVVRGRGNARRTEDAEPRPRAARCAHAFILNPDSVQGGGGGILYNVCARS